MRDWLRPARSLTLVATLALAALAPALAQEAPAPPAENTGRPAFDIDVRAPDAQRELLEQHLSLGRYREVSDLEDVELERLVAQAEQEARRLLATQGYFNPDLRIRVERDRTPPRVVIEVGLNEQARIEQVDIQFEGDVARSTEPEVAEQRETIRRDWPLPVGEPFTQESWSSAKDEALDVLLARRYPRARVSYSLAAVDALASRASLGLRLDSGPAFTLGPLVVTGADRYPELVAQRLARLPEGSVYDRAEIVEAQLRLTGSGYYDSAFIVVDPQGPPSAAPVQLTVREAAIHRWVLGVGLTTDLGPQASVEYRNNRFPNPYWRTEVRTRIERTAPFAEVELLSIPNPDGWRWSGLVRGSRTLDENEQDTRALRLRAGRIRVGNRISREAYLELDRATVRDSTGATASESGAGSALMANYIVSWRYFDSLTLPTRGWGVAAELGAGFTLTGNRRPFQRTVLRGQTFFPFTSSRLLLRSEVGAVFAADDAELPGTQLFRTGGDTSVRGYGFRDIGVRRASGADSPGRYLLVGSVEWLRPIRRNNLPTNLEHTLFIDAGAVADRPGDLDPVLGVGTGVRYNSPIGPLQASVAYGVETQRFRLHLSVGVTF
ncbi:BamA/TamA family outer membrane protein [Ramlibacter sp. AW1]|uniref:Translocation and assembly module subunit TamA n=1 Tax=Ramlibacter aurantiacus TaxID=2801330 RepID=A0A937D4K8_9BURK|nr:BamA/TamA family outer membrane protein [Ramlibacter aurantiacus]MBL0420427.1 BamA/TamA family outer membrane protein [Ramlibacter aurantiacus]